MEWGEKREEKQRHEKIKKNKAANQGTARKWNGKRRKTVRTYKEGMEAKERRIRTLKEDKGREEKGKKGIEWETTPIGLRRGRKIQRERTRRQHFTTGGKVMEAKSGELVGRKSNTINRMRREGMMREGERRERNDRGEGKDN